MVRIRALDGLRGRGLLGDTAILASIGTQGPLPSTLKVATLNTGSVGSAGAANMAAVIKENNLDICVVQEVNNVTNFNAILAALGAGWTGKFATNSSLSYPGGIFVKNHTITSFKAYATTAVAPSSSNPEGTTAAGVTINRVVHETSIDVGGRTLWVIGGHLSPSQYSTATRIGEITFMLGLANNHAGLERVLLGDLNTNYPGEPDYANDVGAVIQVLLNDGKYVDTWKENNPTLTPIPETKIGSGFRVDMIWRPNDVGITNDGTSIVGSWSGGAWPTDHKMPVAVLQEPALAPGPTPAKLTWAPPALTSPITMAFPETGTLTLDPTKDYILTLPTDRALANINGLTVIGGRNVVIIGGRVNVGAGNPSQSPWQRTRGAYFKDQRGTLHLEGVYFECPTHNAPDGVVPDPLVEGIDISNVYGGTIQVQNCYIEYMWGAYLDANGDPIHADAIQTWTGPGKIRVDRCHFETGYQGLFLVWDNIAGAAKPTEFTIKNTYIHGDSRAAYLAWCKSDGADYLTVENLYLKSDARTYNLVEPSSGVWDAATLNAAPPEDYATTAGLGYVSPGYL